MAAPTGNPGFPTIWKGLDNSDIGHISAGATQGEYSRVLAQKVAAAGLGTSPRQPIFTLDTNPSISFCVTPIENGYVVRHHGKDYFVADIAAVGERVAGIMAARAMAMDMA